MQTSNVHDLFKVGDIVAHGEKNVGIVVKVKQGDGRYTADEVGVRWITQTKLSDDGEQLMHRHADCDCNFMPSWPNKPAWSFDKLVKLGHAEGVE